MEAIPRPRPFEQRHVGLLERAGFMHLDLVLIGAALGLIGFSLITLGQTTGEDVANNPHFYVIRQAIYAVVGVALMLAIARVDYSRFRELRVGIYSVMITTIVLVLMLGQATRGSRRWIELPFFTFQPSELGKVLLIVAVAAFAIDTARRISPVRRTARLLLLGTIPALLVFMQPDLGTGAVYVLITLAVMFIAGVRWTHFAALGAIAALVVTVVLVIAPAMEVTILQPYQEERLTAFLDPSEDPADASYQINQALIAVGSGGKTGRGDDATQTQQDFLPERHTDFIFAAVGERFGFVGAAFLLSLYALLIWRALRILTVSKNLYGSMIAGGIAAMFMFHVFVNVGMNVGIMPITGIPLPLMSFGGSSVVVTFLAIGLLQSIYVQAQLTSKRGAQTALR
ncbi:MAG TPA: rod shape-determining protein RodA [Solirubrobacterales bacterium]|jgi:rod shape determining protein RodA|nr:rod shape-determining protein RodA [Solirubrobacterales bacterium]